MSLLKRWNSTLSVWEPMASSIGNEYAYEIDASSSITLTGPQVNNTFLHNASQVTGCDITLPPASAGLVFVMCVAVSGVNAWRLRAGVNDKIYLEGTPGSDNGYIGISNPTVSAFISVFSFRSGVSTWDWMAINGGGIWGII